MGIMDLIPIHDQEEINPLKPGDYTDEDGIVHCGVCGQAKQYHIQMGDFDRIVPCVCDCIKKEQQRQKEEEENREKMRRIQRLKSGSMMAGKFKDSRFESYITRPENEAALNVSRNYCQNWPEMKEKSQGLLFYGPVGTGKSYTAACIANYLLNEGIPVVMTSFVKILQDVHSTEDEAGYISILNAASLLIIDDLGAERNTDYALEKVYNVIDSRVRADKPMILTTNLDIGQMMDCNDIRYKRIYDRIFEVCFPVEISGRSFREEKASQRFDEMKAFITGGTK